MTLIERLRAVAETGCDPDLIDDAIAEIEQLNDERSNLIQDCDLSYPNEYTSPPAPAIPDGFVLVPITLTDAMHRANTGGYIPSGLSKVGVEMAWEAMLKAAPEYKP